MAIFFTILLILFVAVVLIFLIKQIPWPSGLEILGTIGIIIVVVAACLKIWPLL